MAQCDRLVPLPVVSYRMYRALGEIVCILALRESELTDAQRKALARALQARCDTALRMGWGP